MTTYYIGNHYEVKNSVVTKYYFAGATRLAVRTGTTLSFLLGDHIGSSSVTTDANGVKTASALYKAFGETRFSAGNLSTDYKFTGQREEASLGIYYFNARWMDPSLGRFTSPDSIVPTSTQGTQAWDRYAFVNNNPVRYNDPTGHFDQDPGGNSTNTSHKCSGASCAGNTTCSDPAASNYTQPGSCTYNKLSNKQKCPSDIDCIVVANGDATQQDLLGIQDYISKIQEELTLAIIALGLIAIVNPWAVAVITYLGVELAELDRLSTFISKADSVRSSSPGGVLPMTTYQTVTQMGSKTNIGATTLYYHGTYSNGSEAEGTFEPNSPIVEAIIEALRGRE